MPKKKQPTEQEKMNQDFQKSTGMKVIDQPPSDKGTTEFAKDVYKDIPPIAPNPGGK